MATLHLLSHSPFSDTRLESCLRLLGPEDAIVLSGDAVYALTPDTLPQQALQTGLVATNLFALREDVEARNIAVSSKTQLLDYPAFVELCCHFEQVNSWL